eukprot:CAMPEP_0114596304 /NCGR_PEP_ID=MMETSP0125-20121206/18294_1 /TAXON_ID=485358 ORGANISM="Aristerostoma sp., Strain ATCC 50986" /NCGR_SAMPLE_ID=MMETSP0125 /ASSEMBLY_ACC=CAM_ASM_000245 /LENGTH=60 /DNA_ID=CAMNT_0001799141 /DNA_START=242 /DNA_END=424 /DNA_ORIENTATION=+
MENTGYIKVINENVEPLMKVYVKCYAKLKNGEEVFYKDGYTDLRGKFNYANKSGADVSDI